MKKKIIMLSATALFIVSAVIGGVYYQATKIPRNNAGAFASLKKDSSKKIVVVMGDSITHGAVSYDYVGELSRDKELGGFIFINEGINSQLAYHLLGKADNVVKIRPDEIFILIGSNDCMASLSDEEYQRYNRTWNLPVRPTKEWFAANLENLVEKLKSRTAARITLISIPPIGEKADSIPFEKSIEYSRCIKDIALKKKGGYIGFNEALTDEIIKHGKRNVAGFDSNRRAMYSAIALHYLLLESWDEISDNRGLQFLTDNVHLNSRGGHILKTKIKEAIMGKKF
jgi:lysophospholipase L1-like esterase